MKNILTKNRLSVLAMALIAVLSAMYLVQVGLRVSAGQSTRSATMVVDDTNGILPGSKVLLRGIEIGRVTGVQNVADGVQLTWDYRDSENIPERSTFRVDTLSALGEAYVAVLPQTESGPYLKDGATVARKDIVTTTSFKALSSRLTELLTQVDPKGVDRIFRVLDAGLPDGTETISTIERAGKLLADQMVQQNGSLVTLLSAMQPLLMRSDTIPAALRGTGAALPEFGVEFKGVLESFDKVITLTKQYTRGVHVKEQILEGASPVLGSIQKFLDSTGQDLNTIGVNLLPAVSAGAEAMRTVDLGRALTSLIGTTKDGAVTVRVAPSPRPQGTR